VKTIFYWFAITGLLLYSAYTVTITPAHGCDVQDMDRFNTCLGVAEGWR